MHMVRLKISKGGQVSIPAPIRKRWGTSTLIAEDLGDRLLLRPAQDDPIAAARGALAGKIRSSSELRRLARLDERRVEERKWGRF